MLYMNKLYQKWYYFVIYIKTQMEYIAQTKNSTRFKEYKHRSKEYNNLSTKP